MITVQNRILPSDGQDLGNGLVTAEWLLTITGEHDISNCYLDLWEQSGGSFTIVAIDSIPLGFAVDSTVGDSTDDFYFYYDGALPAGEYRFGVTVQADQMDRLFLAATTEVWTGEGDATTVFRDGVVARLEPQPASGTATVTITVTGDAPPPSSCAIPVCGCVIPQCSGSGPAA